MAVAFYLFMTVPKLSAVQESNNKSGQEPRSILLCGDRCVQPSPGIGCFTTVRQDWTTLLALYVFKIGRADTEISLVNSYYSNYSAKAHLHSQLLPLTQKSVSRLKVLANNLLPRSPSLAKRILDFKDKTASIRAH